MESLDVYLNDRKVGRLDDDNGLLSFSYDSAYLASGIREPLQSGMAVVGVCGNRGWHSPPP